MAVDRLWRSEPRRLSTDVDELVPHRELPPEEVDLVRSGAESFPGTKADAGTKDTKGSVPRRERFDQRENLSGLERFDRCHLGLG